MLTVREAMSIGVMRRAQVLAGAGGLDREISSITVMDTPDIGTWLQGGELLLSNIFVIRDEPDRQIDLVRDLVRRGAAALGIKLKRYVDAVPAQMVDLADALKLPVIEMPVDCAWIDIMVPLYREMTDRQAVHLQRAREIHRAFTQAALGGRGAGGAVRLLARLTGAEVAVVNPEGRMISQSPSDLPWDMDDVMRRLGGARGVRGRRHRERAAAPGCHTHPIKAGRQLLGYILLRPEAALVEPDVAALEHAATVLALELVKLQAVEEVERRFRNALLWDLLTGEVSSVETLEARARHVGIRMDADSSYVVLVIDIDGFERYCAEVLQRDEARARQVHERFVRSVQSAAAYHAPGSVCMDHSDSVTVLLPSAAQSGKEGLVRLASALRAGVLRTGQGLSVSIGLSRVCDFPLKLADGYREARQALLLGRQLRGHGHITHFGELGSFRVLFSGGDRQEAERFYREIMAPVEEYEQSRPCLLETLGAYFRCGGDPAECARQLYVHPNTVRYRIRKVEALTGLRLDDQEDRFNLQLALKLRSLFRGDD